MKIALLTIWHEKNFGAEMQAYATVRALKELGHDVEVIDFRLTESCDFNLKHRLNLLISSFSDESHGFRQFWRKFIPAGPHYKTIESLQKNPPKADLYLAGSDQIWNPDITKGRWKAFFLNFGNEETPRASYASSIGEDHWKWDRLNDYVSARLSKFHAIAVREASAQRILAEKFGLNSEVVLDPTLLHKDYNEIIIPESTQHTLVYYPLTENPELECFSKKLAEEKGLTFVNTNKKKKLFNRIVWRRTSLPLWIKNIAEASFVVTPSFHGLAFSLIYNRQFIVIQNAKKEIRSSRITGLLDKLGLSDRYFTNVEDALASGIWEQSIDYSQVNRKLDQLRTQSWKYLKSISDSKL